MTMRRRVGLRRTGFTADRRTPISRGSAPRGVSAKRKSQRVRVRLRRASKKRVGQMVQRTAMLLGLKDAVGHRCEYCTSLGRTDRKCWPLDGHEVRKPRATYWLNPTFVAILGRPHHDMCEASFSSKTGRLVIPGNRDDGWGFAVVRAASKQAYQATYPEAFSVGSDH